MEREIETYFKYISTISIISFFIFASKNRFKLLNITNYFLPENTRNIYYVNSSFDNQKKYFSLMPKLYKKNYSSDGKFLKNTKTVFLIGDSHVNNHIPSIVKAIQELEKQVKVVRLKGSFFYKDSNKIFTNYEQKKNFILGSLRSAIN